MRAARIVRALARAGVDDDAIDAAVTTLVEEEWETLMEEDDTAVVRAARIIRALARAGVEDDAIDAAVTALVEEEWETLMEPVLEPLLRDVADALARGESLDAWRDRLPQRLDEMDDDAVVESLRRMGFSARLSGAAGLE